jgi:hypothetical protein
MMRKTLDNNVMIFFVDKVFIQLFAFFIIQNTFSLISFDNQ